MGPFLRLRGLMGPAIVLMATLIALVPLLLRGSSCNGDLVFHYISWIDAEHSISTGLLYPHWANSPNFGAGQPQFVFYPPISWMAGAILGMILPWSFVPVALSILLLAGTGLATRALAREMLGDQPATLAGCAAIFFGYALFVIYARNDFAESTGGFWFPLLLLFALRRRNTSGSFWERTFDGSAVPLALVVAGAWLSNGPLGIMSIYLLAAVSLVSTMTDKSPVPAVRAAVSAIGGLGLASVYLIPAVWERKWVNLQNAVNTSEYTIENSWLYARHADPALIAHDGFLHHASNVAVLMLGIAFVGGAVARIRGVLPGERRWWLPMALIPPAILFLLFPVSQPVWNLLPELRLLQFPWRWLVVLEAPMAIWFASAVWSDRRAVRIPLIAVCAVGFLGISFVIPRWWWAECDPNIAAMLQSAPKGVAIPGKPEYASPGIRYPVLNLLVDAQRKPLVDPLGRPVLDSQGKPLLESLDHADAQSLPDACLLDSTSNSELTSAADSAPAWRGEATDCDSSGWQQFVVTNGLSSSDEPRYLPEQKLFAGIARRAGYLILRLRYYPAWGVKVNGIPVTAVPDRERGLMAVRVPEGPVQVSVDWTTTGDVIAARWVSGIALLLLICLHLFERKRLWAHLRLRFGSASPRTFVEKSKLPAVELKQGAQSAQKKRKKSPSRKLPKTSSGR